MSIGPTRRPLNRSRSYQVRTGTTRAGMSNSKTLAANASKEEMQCKQKAFNSNDDKPTKWIVFKRHRIESATPHEHHTNTRSLTNSSTITACRGWWRWRAIMHTIIGGVISHIHAYTTAAPRTDDVRSRRRFQPLASITIGSVDASAVPEVIVAARKTDSSREGLFEVLHPFFFICHCLVKK